MDNWNRWGWAALSAAARDVCSESELLGFYVGMLSSHPDLHVSQTYVDTFEGSRTEPVRLAAALCAAGVWRRAKDGYDIPRGSWLWECLETLAGSVLLSSRPPASSPLPPSPPVPPSTPRLPSLLPSDPPLQAATSTARAKAKPKGPEAEQLQRIWNEGCGDLLKWVTMSPERRRIADKRLAELPDLDAWRKVVAAVARSPWCNGKNNSGWRAGVDYLLRENTWPNALEGVLDDRDLRRRVSPEERRVMTRHANSVELKQQARKSGSRLNVVNLDEDEK